MSRREAYLVSRITSKLADRARVLRIVSKAQDVVTGAVRDIECPVEQDITLQEIAAAAVTMRCHNGKGAQAAAHCSTLAYKAGAATERLVKQRVRG